jgi:hypothetical protein
MRVRRTVRRGVAAASTFGLIAVLTACDPPTTVTTPINYDCLIDTDHILVPNTTTDLAADYAMTAPQAVAPGANFTLNVVPQPFAVDGTPTGAGTVSQISNVVWKVTVPANATLTGHTISDWSNVGPGTPTSSAAGNTITVTVPGPILANTTAQFPKVTMLLTSTGAVGSRVQPKIAGTSHASPGLSFNSRVTGTILGTLNSTLSCFPDPSPALHSVLISNDTLAPAITITSPVANQTIVRNTTVIADYACNDGPSGVGVASCVGTVADGAPINTSTLGTQTFTVTATDNEGKVGTKSVTYTVVAA